MKRFGIGLLSLGLVAAFSMSAFAANMDFGGHLRIRGWYNDNQALLEDTAANAGHSSFFEQRLRLSGRIRLADGVLITTRFDALENFWGFNRTPLVGGVPTSTTDSQNLQWEIANMSFKTKFGSFLVGSTNAPLAYGTKYWESGEGVRYIIRYTVPVGPLEVRATWEKKAESQVWGSAVRDDQDGDNDIYAIAAKYKGKAFETGVQLQHMIDNSARAGAASATTGFSKRLSAFQPYLISKFGNLDLQLEGLYVFGDAKKYDAPAGANIDVDASGYGAFFNAKYTMGPAYLAFMASYTTGDDPATADEQEGSFAANFDGASSQGGSSSPRPLLILQNTTFNSFFGNQVGNLRTGAGSYVGRQNIGPMAANNDNCMQFNIYGDYAFTPKWDLFFTVTYTKADEKPQVAAAGGNQAAGVFIDDEIGTEVDVVLNYKITGQLTYSVQAAYFKVGDYFKGNPAVGANVTVDDNYVLMHALLLEF